MEQGYSLPVSREIWVFFFLRVRHTEMALGQKTESPPPPPLSASIWKGTQKKPGVPW